MSNLDTALIIVLSMTAFMFLGQIAILETNPDMSQQFFNCKDSIFGHLEANNCTGPTYQINDQNPGNSLPRGQSGVSATTGNIFTDTFASAKAWLLDSTGLSYLLTILGAPASFLKAAGFPSSFSFAMGVLWYGTVFFLIVAWLLARQ